MAPEMPPRIARLPKDKHGRPVPWFVAWIDGTPDFRVVAPGKIRLALRAGLCWVCGEPLTAYKAFTIGPMCCINRVSPEPPAHRDCAVYSAQACPFLTVPSMRRRENRLPEGASDPAGVMIRRNPGAVLVWVTRSFKPFHPPGESGLLFKLGGTEETLWFTEGRTATRAEVDASIESGLPLLRDAAEEDGPDALRELDLQIAAAQPLLPAVAHEGG